MCTADAGTSPSKRPNDSEEPGVGPLVADRDIRSALVLRSCGARMES